MNIDDICDVIDDATYDATYDMVMDITSFATRSEVYRETSNANIFDTFNFLVVNQNDNMLEFKVGV